MNFIMYKFHCQCFFSVVICFLVIFSIYNELFAVYNSIEVISMDTLGKRLKHARKSKGYTQQSLAKAIGVSRGVIFNLEKDKTEPQTIVINAICQELNEDKEWLVNGTEEIENISKSSQSSKVLAELYEIAKGLSEDELLYLLNQIKALKILLDSENDV